MTPNELAPLFDDAVTLYWRRECGKERNKVKRLEAKIIALETEIGLHNGINHALEDDMSTEMLARVQNVRTCELVWR